jgi:hypothetical protein
MKWKILLTLVAALSIMASGVYADTLVGSSGTWQAYVTPNQNNKPYWDGNSSDASTSATVGDFLTNTGYFHNNLLYPSPGLTDPQWWGNAITTNSSGKETGGGTAAATMYFQPTTTSGGDIATLLVEVAGYASTNTFGWYLTTTPSDRHQIFPGSAGAGTVSAVFTPTGNYGFYIGVGSGANQTYYYMTSSNNVADKNIQHFAVFRPSDTGNIFYIGIEDLPWCSSDKDFQDMVVRVTPAGGGNEVPLPPSALLLGSGLLGLLIMRRSKR